MGVAFTGEFVEGQAADHFLGRIELMSFTSGPKQGQFVVRAHYQ